MLTASTFQRIVKRELRIKKRATLQIRVVFLVFNTSVKRQTTRINILTIIIKDIHSMIL